MAGLYIHIPFCHSKCAYCDFFSTPDTKLRSNLVASIAKEWDMRKHELNNEPLKTIYIGGGTPSILTSDELHKLVSFIPTVNVEEFTIEANPEDINPDWVSNIKAIGCNRVSIGIQSLHDNELETVGRRHSGQDALDAIEILKAGGIQNISADLIYGLPGQTLKSWEYSVATLLATGIKHMSAYSLSYEPGTRLYAMLISGKLQETPEDITAEMYRILCRITTEAGFDHYEISNFSLPGWHSRHNSSYWDYSPYLGLGPGAHSFDGIIRRMNPSKLQKYIETISQAQPFYESEMPSANDAVNDAIITGLRTSKGLDLSIIECIGSHACLLDVQKNLEKYLKYGKIIQTSDGCFRIPENHWLISDAIMRDIIL